MRIRCHCQQTFALQSSGPPPLPYPSFLSLSLTPQAIAAELKPQVVHLQGELTFAQGQLEEAHHELSQAASREQELAEEFMTVKVKVSGLRRTSARA